jgi:hypothetical protein
MPKASKKYLAFDRMMRQLLTVPKSELDARVRAHKERSALNPRKRGPKPKNRAPAVDDQSET